jgi:hypothetical protein
MSSFILLKATLRWLMAGGEEMFETLWDMIGWQ